MHALTEGKAREDDVTMRRVTALLLDLGVVSYPWSSPIGMQGTPNAFWFASILVRSG